MKTHIPKQKEIERKRYLIDAANFRLGRLATRASIILRGKDKPEYTPHLDLGDYLVVINAAKIKISGKKRDQKKYYHHTGYPGNIRSVKLSKLLTDKPEQVIYRAVRGMIPDNRLKKGRLARLEIYSDDNQPYQEKELFQIEAD
jgi:large subunit ribosomal protein L13